MLNHTYARKFAIMLKEPVVTYQVAQMVNAWIFVPVFPLNPIHHCILQKRIAVVVTFFRAAYNNIKILYNQLYTYI